MQYGATDYVYFRVFFKELEQDICEKKSSIKKRLEEDNSLQHYKLLQTKNLDWAHYRHGEQEQPPLRYLQVPPKEVDTKKTKSKKNWK